MDLFAALTPDRGRTSPSTIKKAVELLQSGKLVMAYPAGTRSRTDAEMKRGAATIALLARARVVPAHYDGPETLRVSHLFRRPEIRVTFGRAIAPDGEPTREAILELSSRIAETLAENDL